VVYSQFGEGEQETLPAITEYFLDRLAGRILEDGRPIRRVVEVRFESATSGLIDVAYTSGGDDFEFQSVPVNISDSYFLVIQELGYLPVREEVRLGQARQDMRSAAGGVGRGVISTFGIVILDLISAPGDGSPGGADTVGLDQLLNDVPGEAREAYQDALDALDAGDQRSAIPLLERAIEIAPTFYEALGRLGVAYLSSDQLAEARTVLERARDINAADSLLLTNLGTLYFQEGQLSEQMAASELDLQAAQGAYGDAVDHLVEAARLDPTSPRVYYYLGTAQYKIGLYDAAEENLFLAMDWDPTFDQARLTLINVFVRQERYEAALEQIDLYLDAHPDAPDRPGIEQARAAIERNRDGR
jgi:tetratricopeptide (TPR) repeat protein